MKPYGLVRFSGFQDKYMDLVDCLERGAKSCCMKIKPKNRQTTRQIWKGKERSMVKAGIKNDFRNI